jgi:alkylhydroperoxidase family enzyme
MPRTNVYVDGFNLYYGAVKDTPYKWLDIHKLCSLLLPQNQIHRIRYFTALVQNTPNDPTKAQRQQTFIRALETLPNLSVHYGSFLASKVRMPLVHPTALRHNALVVKMEEKGSDVNLASLLLADAFRGDFEAAAVLSNDSDLVLPIKIVATELHLPVGIINPHKRFAVELTKVATFRKQIRHGALRVSQFPPSLTDANGTITKPASW